MKTVILRLILIFNLFALAACSSIPSAFLDSEVKNTVLRASGYSEIRQIPQLTTTQVRYASEQNATLLAYRSLASQVYHQQLSTGNTVADQVIKDELFRIYADLFLREAKAKKFNVIADQIKVSLELTLTPRFYHCIGSSTQIVKLCLKEDNKIPFTRIGNQKSSVATVNLSCASSECNSGLHIAGFSKEKNVLDKALLNIGLYDSEWTGNIAVETMLRYLYLTKIVFN